MPICNCLHACSCGYAYVRTYLPASAAANGPPPGARVPSQRIHEVVNYTVPTTVPSELVPVRYTGYILEYLYLAASPVCKHAAKYHYHFHFALGTPHERTTPIASHI